MKTFSEYLSESIEFFKDITFFTEGIVVLASGLLFSSYKFYFISRILYFFILPITVFFISQFTEEESKWYLITICLMSSGSFGMLLASRNRKYQGSVAIPELYLYLTSMIPFLAWRFTQGIYWDGLGFLAIFGILEILKTIDKMNGYSD